MSDSTLSNKLSELSKKSFPKSGLQIEIPDSDLIDGLVLDFQPLDTGFPTPLPVRPKSDTALDTR